MMLAYNMTYYVRIPDNKAELLQPCISVVLFKYLQPSLRKRGN